MEFTGLFRYNHLLYNILIIKVVLIGFFLQELMQHQKILLTLIISSN